MRANEHNFRRAFWIAAVVLMAGLGVQAQETNETTEVMPTPLPPDPAVETPQVPVVIPPHGKPDQPGRPPRASVPGRSDPSEALKDLVREFQVARQAFLEDQKELLQDIRDANAQQRAMIRMQLKDNLKAWLQEQKSQIQELREQAKQIRNNVPSLDPVIKAATDEPR